MNVPRWLAWSAVGLAVIFLAWTEGKAAGLNAVTFETAENLLHGHTTAQRVQDSLEVVRLGAKAAADSLRAHPRYVQIVTAYHDTIRAIDTVWVNQQVADLNHAYTACDLALTLCHARSDSLETSLRAVLKARECSLPFGIRCPSRGVMFLGGAVLGALLENRLSH